MSVTPDAGAPIRPAYIRDAASGLYYRIGVANAGTDTGGGGVTDHGLLTGLGDDDHLQYHTDSRGDARYATLAHVHPETTEFTYVYDNVATMADPGSGKVRTDTAAGVPNTQMAFSYLTALGKDATNTFKALANGDLLYFQQQDNASNWARYRLLSGVNNTTWWLFNVEFIEQQGAAIAKNQNVLVKFTAGGANNGVVDHGLLTGLGDDDHTQYYNQARGDARYTAIAHDGLTTAHSAMLSSTTPANISVSAGQVGNGTTFARSNHVHAAATIAPVALGVANATGTSNSFARADHVHIFPTAANVGAESAGAVATHAATAGHELLSSTTPAALGTAAVGVGNTTARADHVHKMPTAEDVGALTPELDGKFCGIWNKYLVYPSGSIVIGPDGFLYGTRYGADISEPLPMVPDGVNNAASAPSIVIHKSGSTVAGFPFSNAGFTSEAGEPSTTNSKNLSAWWKYEPVESGWVTFSTSGTTGDTVMVLYKHVGSPFAFANLTQVAFDDDSGEGSTSQLTYPVVGGETYYIQVGEYYSATCYYVLTISDAASTVSYPAWEQLTFPSMSQNDADIRYLQSAGGQMVGTIEVEGDYFNALDINGINVGISFNSSEPGSINFNAKNRYFGYVPTWGTLAITSDATTRAPFAFADPTQTYHGATKKYVDDRVVFSASEPSVKTTGMIWVQP